MMPDFGKISHEHRQVGGPSGDIVLRANDMLDLPKQPAFVLVGGQVYNPTASTYRPGRDAAFYLRQVGGVISSGDGKNIYILRAAGSSSGPMRGSVSSEDSW